MSTSFSFIHSFVRLFVGSSALQSISTALLRYVCMRFVYDGEIHGILCYFFIFHQHVWNQPKTCYNMNGLVQLFCILVLSCVLLVSKRVNGISMLPWISHRFIIREKWTFVKRLVAFPMCCCVPKRFCTLILTLST